MSTNGEEIYDVFLSHKYLDTGWVKELAKQLEDRAKLHVFLDRWILLPGKPWRHEKINSLNLAKSYVICIGEKTPKDWFQEEIRRALDRQIEDPSFRIILVLLPKAQEYKVDDFLGIGIRVDFSKGLDDKYAFYRLLTGIIGVAPGRGLFEEGKEDYHFDRWAAERWALEYQEEEKEEEEEEGEEDDHFIGAHLLNGADRMVGSFLPDEGGMFDEECGRNHDEEDEEEPLLLGVSAPRAVRPSDIFTARFVAYIKSSEEEVKQELLELSRGRSESYMGVESCRWELDTHVIVKLSGKHLKVNPSESEFIWKGERNFVNFVVEVLADDSEKWTVLIYEVFIDGIRIAFIPLDLEIKSSIKSEQRNIVVIEPAHTAFASYASLDRIRVLDRVAAVRISAGLDIFMDCLSLHPGEEWKLRLEKEISVRDIFLLFWSKNALNSEWVKWEWKKALQQKDESAIQLHPLQTVSEAPPPEELKKFHFGDIYMIVRDSLKKNDN